MPASAPAPRLALAVGDPNGIGPEIALKAAQALQSENVNLTLYGPSAVLTRTAAMLGLSQLWERLDHVATPELSEQAARPGQIEAEAGASAVASASAALRACRAGRHDAVVACPHHETAIARAGIPFSGYPSLVARVCGLPEDSRKQLAEAQHEGAISETERAPWPVSARRWSPMPPVPAFAPAGCWASPHPRSASSASIRMPPRMGCSAPKTAAWSNRR